jgi:hypothetical protein
MKQLLPLPVMSMLCIPIRTSAQVYGNYQYNQQPRAQGHDRNAASNTAIAGNGEITLKVNGLMNIVADNYIAASPRGYRSGAIIADMLSFVPRYEMQAEKRLFSKTYNEVPAGFELQKNVLVRA